MKLLWHPYAPPKSAPVPLPERRVPRTFVAHCPHCSTFKAVAMTEGRVIRALSNHIICAHFPTKRTKGAAA
jgi:hypothetical protein